MRGSGASGPNLILDPTPEDLEMAEAYERGEIEAFEYADARTYPPGREIVRANAGPRH